MVARWGVVRKSRKCLRDIGSIAGVPANLLEAFERYWVACRLGLRGLGERMTERDIELGRLAGHRRMIRSSTRAFKRLIGRNGVPKSIAGAVREARGTVWHVRHLYNSAAPTIAVRQ